MPPGSWKLVTSPPTRIIRGGTARYIEKVYIERTRGVNFIKLGGGDPLWTLYRAEGLTAGLDAGGK